MKLDSRGSSTTKLDIKGMNIDRRESRAPIPAGEVVMLGAHLDTWHSSTGATDNAAGVAAMMEAVRILKTLGVSRGGRSASRSGPARNRDSLGSRPTCGTPRGCGKTKAGVPEARRDYNLDNGTGRSAASGCRATSRSRRSSRSGSSR